VAAREVLLQESRGIRVFAVEKAGSLPTLAPSKMSGSTASPGDAVLGTWLVDENAAAIEIYREEGAYFGKISWLGKKDDREKAAPESSPGMYEQPHPGMVILRNFRFDGSAWTDGTLYNPTNGKTYRGVLHLDAEGELHVRGFVGLELLGHSVVWKRAP
jgi:uncharacterized protein (DUF2147 family)